MPRTVNLRAAFAAAILAISTLGIPAPALAQSNTFAIAPYPEKARETLRMPAGKVATALRLEAADAAAIDAIKLANSRSVTKRVQIGIGRSAEAHAEARDTSLRWVPVVGGVVAHWEVTSPDARALRVGLAAARMAPGVEIRFAGSAEIETVYGPVSAAELKPGSGVYWSPVLEGDTATVEVFVALGASPSDFSLAIAQVAHLFVSPADSTMEVQAKASQFCEVDLICRSASDSALASTGRSVARMTYVDGGSSYTCTGTLLNPSSGPLTPYFYSAAHCMSAQTVASTLTTHWFYDAQTCGSGTVRSDYTQVSGGATLLYANTDTDVLLLRLNSSPPGGAVYSGWDATSLASGTAMTAVHHPAGDLKKVSLATMDGFQTPGGHSATFIVSRWNAVATGVTEGGSSGSGIFTAVGSPASEYRLRGGLLGGPSSCSAPTSSLYDYYSRFDNAYAQLAQYLNPGGGGGACTYSLSPTSASVGAGAASGTFSVTAGSGCAWSATSNASWLTTSSSGSGNGTASYSVAANTGSSSRSGTITAGGKSFTVTQAAATGGGTPTGSNVVANPGFEGGSASWTQVPAGTLIVTNASVAHAGSSYAWLGGYDSGNDTLSQDVAIPSSASSATLQFWYQINTTETSTSAAYDTMTVALVNPSTGAVLTTLATFSNLNATSGWVQSAAYDVSAYRGQTVRLRFVALTDFSNISSFRIDDVSLATGATTGGGVTNYTSMWWNPAESGWGFNVNHQGNTIFATLFTYDAFGNPMWLVMANGALQLGSTYSGDLYRTTGPAFNSVPYVALDPSDIVKVGTMTMTFSGSNAATLSYTVNGVPVTKSIQKQVFGTRAAECVGTDAVRNSATNYTDMWWNPGESGWGINLTQQGEVIFATLFTYASDRQGLWLVMANGARQPDGSFLGDLFRTTGPAFNAQPFTPLGAGNVTAVGTMRLRFTSGTTATLEYSVNGATVTKSISRQAFGSPAPLCS